MLLASRGMIETVTNLYSENNLPMSQLNAPVVIRVKVLVIDNLSLYLCSSQLLALGPSLSLAFYAQSPAPSQIISNPGLLYM